MADIREAFKTQRGKPGKMVDFDKAATELSCRKESLTKDRASDFKAWVDKQL